MANSVDVLIITALKMEFDAAKTAFSSTKADQLGVFTWSEIVEPANAPYLLGKYRLTSAEHYNIALARPTRMGSNNTIPIATILSSLLRPQCLVMCGVCAGNPGDVALGDVVISELAYAYDEGKREPDVFIGDHRQSPISDDWLRAAQELSNDGLPSHGPATREDAEFWLLERLYKGADPRKHPARTRYFREGEWASAVKCLESRKLVERRGDALHLTEAGVEQVDQSLVYEVDPPKQLPFALHVGPFASGNVVVKDGMTWDRLKGMGVRSVVALEMEAASIGIVARQTGVAEWIVIKGVMDHADPTKDDRFKPFAARASAEVLARFLKGRFESAAKIVAAKSGPPPRLTWKPRSPKDSFFDEVGRALDKHAPRFRGLFDLARNAAINAYEAAEGAYLAAEEARHLLGDFLTKAHADPQKDVTLRGASNADGRSFLAKVWDSHDEYLGHGRGRIAEGKGVFKIYRFSKSATPDLISAYAGCVEVDRYGPSGVFTFFDRSQFAGEWSDGHPKFGYREYVGDGNDVEGDFYLGAMSTSGDRFSPRWYPQGKGIIVDATQRRIICGEFRAGKIVSSSDAIEF